MPKEKMKTQERLRPLGDRVLVKRLPAEELSKGGLIIPENAKEKPQRGRIVAVGDGRVMKNGQRVPVDLSVGDLVLFGKYAGHETKAGEGELLILHEDDVIGVIAE